MLSLVSAKSGVLRIIVMNTSSVNYLDILESISDVVEQNLPVKDASVYTV